MRAGKPTDLGKYSIKLFLEPRQRTLDRTSALWKRAASGDPLWRRSCDPWQGCVTCGHFWQGAQGAEEQGCWGEGRPRGRSTWGAEGCLTSRAACGAGVLRSREAEEQGGQGAKVLVALQPLGQRGVYMARGWWPTVPLRTKGQRQPGGDRGGPTCCLSTPHNQTRHGLSVPHLAQAVRGCRLSMAALPVSCPGAEGVPARAGLDWVALLPHVSPRGQLLVGLRKSSTPLGPGATMVSGWLPLCPAPASKRLRLLLLTSHACPPLLRQRLIHQIWSLLTSHLCFINFKWAAQRIMGWLCSLLAGIYMCAGSAPYQRPDSGVVGITFCTSTLKPDFNGWRLPQKLSKSQNISLSMIVQLKVWIFIRLWTSAQCWI